MESVNVFNSIRHRITSSGNNSGCDAVAGVTPKVTFWHDPFYLGIEEPTPALQCLPDWLKSMPSLAKTRDYEFQQKLTPTIKRCPGIIDFYKYAYIVKLWTDTIIHIKEDREWTFTQALEPGPTNAVWEGFDENQCDKYIPSVEKTLKVCTPWHVLTPKGYSMLQLPLWWEFNKDWEASAGVWDTDISPIININIIFKNLGIYRLAAGTPLVMLIPFKREKFEFSVTERTDFLHNIEKLWYKYVNRTWGTNRGFRNMYRRLQER